MQTFPAGRGSQPYHAILCVAHAPKLAAFEESSIDPSQGISAFVPCIRYTSPPSILKRSHYPSRLQHPTAAPDSTLRGTRRCLSIATMSGFQRLKLSASAKIAYSTARDHAYSRSSDSPCLDSSMRMKDSQSRCVYTAIRIARRYDRMIVVMRIFCLVSYRIIPVADPYRCLQ